MWGLTTSRPRHCLKIGAQALAWGEAVRTWRGRYRYRCVLSPTPTGAIKLSPMDLNLTDMSAVESRLRSLAGPSRDLRFAGRVWLSDVPRPIVLLLSDLSVRAAVLQLEQLPAQVEEQEALIRWRLGQEQLLPLAGAKIVWQGFPSHGAGDPIVVQYVTRQRTQVRARPVKQTLHLDRGTIGLICRLDANGGLLSCPRDQDSSLLAGNPLGSCLRQSLIFDLWSHAMAIPHHLRTSPISPCIRGHTPTKSSTQNGNRPGRNTKDWPDTGSGPYYSRMAPPDPVRSHTTDSP